MCRWKLCKAWLAPPFSQWDICPYYSRRKGPAQESRRFSKKVPVYLFQICARIGAAQQKEGVYARSDTTGEPGGNHHRHQETREIGQGLVVFLGVMKGDTEAQAEFLAEKAQGLRISPTKTAR